MSDRHPKWQRVEAGAIIPAGQPYRLEWDAEDYLAAREHRGNVTDLHVGTLVAKPDRVFIDSSWKPPLDLPTGPTWGIAVLNGPEFVVGHWQKSLSIPGTLCKQGGDGNCEEHSWPLDFIELTPEQIQRIETAT